MSFNRVFLIVLDSFGIGELPDAADYGDKGSNTLRTLTNSPKLKINNMLHLGLFNIDGVDYINGTKKAKAAHGRLAELSRGKDTTIGHWEIAGIISEKPLPTYPQGFPNEIIDKFSKLCGRGVLCNKPYSGTKVINDYGRQHIETGSLIVYTSADSVFQIAAHEDVVPLDELYNCCKIAREILVGEHGVGRVIARPFIGEYPDFKRTSNRHDFSILPPKNTLLDYLKNSGYDVIGVGKIFDIFAGRGITEKFFTKNNEDGMKKTFELANKNFTGLCFTNLVDFDMLYGHRNDIDGYANALSEFDLWLKDFMAVMRKDDLLIITSDHGCDPGTESTDHSREYAPLLVYGNNINAVNLGTRQSFSDIGKTIAEIFSVKADIAGSSFLSEIYN